MQMTRANARIPYKSAVQLSDEIGDVNFLHISTEDGDELVKLEDNRGVPFDFRF